MARRRLNTILATTTLAAGLSVAPAWGQSLGDLTSTLEETVEGTTGAVEDVVEDTTEVVEDTLEETANSLTGSSNGDGPTLDTKDLPVLDDLDDVPLDVDVQVDIAPQDEDGSLQLEVDGGVAVGDQAVDVGSVTDPIEDAVDPDPAPAPDAGDEGEDDDAGEDDDEGVTGTSSDSVVRDDAWDDARPGGVLEGGGVIAAGTGPRTADTPESGSSPGQSRSGTAMGESFAAFVASHRGSDWSRGGADSSLSRSQVLAPRVAGPDDPAFEAFPDAQVEEPDVMATPVATGEPTDPREALLRWVAAAMVLGTAITFKRRGLGQV